MMSIHQECPRHDPTWTDGILIIDHLLRAGFQAYAVGGCVRDLILRRPVKDIDVATSAHPEQVEQCFRSIGLVTLPVGKQFGVVIVVAPSGRNIEVATFRHDGVYIDGRRPQTIAFSSAEDDVQRRDFTINALLFDPTTEIITDYVDGMADLSNAIVRAVGDPALRMTEDRLRVLRALRFAAHLVLRIEDHTWDAVCRTSIDGLSAERLMQEWIKGMTCDHPDSYVRLLISSSKLASLCPPLATTSKAQRATLSKTLSRLGSGASVVLAAATWLAAAPRAEVDAWLDRQPLSRQLVTGIRWLLDQGHDPAPLLAQLRHQRRRRYHHDDAPQLMRFVVIHHPQSASADAFVRELEAERVQLPWMPLVRAHDVMSLGIPAGPTLGRILRRLEDAELDGLFSERHGGMQLAQQWLDEQS